MSSYVITGAAKGIGFEFVKQLSADSNNAVFAMCELKFALRKMHTTNAFLPLLKKGSAKKVLCLSSALGDLDLTLSGEVAGQPAYSMSKAAMNMVVAKYAAQYKAHGFVFLAVSPGLVKTSLLPGQLFNHVQVYSMPVAFLNHFRSGQRRF
ncbi:hypothetical protein DFH06DRAFT_1186667 [Mycena polygramma]|nr:hypothetical protein DFH06DRAFT_1186667 [Mycena polygramma]